MIRCKDTRLEEMLHAYELDILPDEDRERLELHLLECASCMESVREFFPVAQRLRQDSDIRQPIHKLALEETKQAEDENPDKKSHKQTWTILTPISIAAAAVFLLLILKDWTVDIRPTQKAMADFGWQSSVAVIPFEDLSQQQDQAYFCAGMAEEIINRLSRIPELKIISRSAVVRFSDTDLTIHQIAEELKVTNILRGSIQREGNRLRIFTELIDVSSGTSLWSKRLDATMESVFEIQDDISKDVAAALQVQLIPQVITELAKKKQPPLAAYEYFLRGKHFFLDRFMATFKVEDFEACVQNLRKAIQVDSTYALAYAGLGFAYSQYALVSRSWYVDSLASHYLHVAFDMDSTSFLTLLGKGWIEFRKDRPEETFRRYTAALELEPNSEIANRMMADFLRSKGLFDQAKMYYRKSIDLAPFIIWTRGMYVGLLVATGKVEEADSQLVEILKINPNNLMYLSRRAWMPIARRDLKRAEKVLAQAERIWNPDGTRESVHNSIGMMLAHLYAAKGMPDSAFALIDTTRAGRYIEGIFALLGMKDRAVDHINKRMKLIEKRGGDYRLYGIESTYLSLINHPFLLSLRGNLRYEELIKRQRETYEENLGKYSPPAL